MPAQIGAHTPAQPRIAPLPRDRWNDDVRELLTVAGGGSINALNIHTTLAQNPGILRKWLPYGGKLMMGSKLPLRVRELAILRIAWLCESAYEWGQHVEIAHQVGIGTDEVEQVTAGPSGAGWSELDAAVLHAVDELHGTASLSDATWATLAATFDDARMIELIMLIGLYQSVAYFLNATGVQLEPGMGGLESR